MYVRDFAPNQTPPYGTERVQISVDGGDKPRWSNDGRSIYFLLRNSLMQVSVQTTGSSLQAGVPVTLFDTRPQSYVPYDVLVDGTFIVNQLVETPDALIPPIRVLMHWQSRLKK